MFGKKRLLIAASGLTALGAAGAMVAGVTFGLFSANTGTQTPADTFATGTVSIGTPANTNCAITNMVPGDESLGYAGFAGDGITGNDQVTKDATCEFQVTYTGSAPAFIGLSTTESGNLPLVWEISQAATDTQPGAFATSGVINTNTATDPLYVATSAAVTYTFWVDYALPTLYASQTNTGASLGLTVYAVQSGNNGSGVCTAGLQCANVTNWS